MNNPENQENDGNTDNHDHYAEPSGKNVKYPGLCGFCIRACICAFDRTEKCTHAMCRGCEAIELEKWSKATEEEKVEIMAQYSLTEVGSRCNHEIFALTNIESKSWLKKAQQKKNAPGWENLPET